MRHLKNLIMVVYMILMLAVGLFILAASLGLLSTADISSALDTVRGSVSAQVTLMIISVFVLIVALVVFFRVWDDVNRGKLLTFQNPDGVVTVSICAIEDYVQKVVKTIPEITNVRSKVTFNKKGLNITSGISISAGANIPGITEKIQMEVRNKIQALLGVAENVNMTLKINKVIGDVPPDMGGEPQEP